MFIVVKLFYVQLLMTKHCYDLCANLTKDSWICDTYCFFFVVVVFVMHSHYIWCFWTWMSSFWNKSQLLSIFYMKHYIH